MSEQPRDEAERKRRLAEVFGDVLPETTSDERDDESGADDSARDTWFRDQVPPHHGIGQTGRLPCAASRSRISSSSATSAGVPASSDGK